MSCVAKADMRRKINHMSCTLNLVLLRTVGKNSNGDGWVEVGFVYMSYNNAEGHG